MEINGKIEKKITGRERILEKKQWCYYIKLRNLINKSFQHGRGGESKKRQIINRRWQFKFKKIGFGKYLKIS